MNAPKPDRSDHPPNLARSAENPVLDLGWNEGTLSDSRPYRVEAWAEDQVMCVTFFMSTSGIENHSNAQFADLLEREQLIAWQPGRRRSAAAMPCTDASGNSMWSVNVVRGDDEETFADVLIVIRPYADGQPAASLHTAPSADLAWSVFAGALATCLAALEDDEFLIISAKRANDYVQFAGGGMFGMRAEASCNTFVEAAASLADDPCAVMASLGWQRATQLPPTDSGVYEPNGSPNFFVDIASPVNHTALAQLAVTTFRAVHGITHPGGLQYNAFDMHQSSLRFPTLRLKRCTT